MATNKKAVTNGSNGRNGHVSLAREEYEAFQALDERCSVLSGENAKLQNTKIDMAATLDAQAKHLSAFELKVTHLERINALQTEYIAILKDKEKVLGVQELSEFWRQWTVYTSNAVDTGKLKREEVQKFEPDLFKMWRNWINDSGKADRGLSVAGSREPITQAMLQTHLLARKNEENVKLAARIVQLEQELENAKAIAAAAKATAVGAKP